MLCSASLVACGGPSSSSPSGGVGLHPTTAVSADCGASPAGRRSLVARLEVERGPGSIRFDGVEHGPGCVQYDLTPGTHHVVVHAEGESGFGILSRFQIVDAPREYDTFLLSCGVPGSCDNETLRGWRRDIEADRTRMTDPCGAAKVTAIKWDTEALDEVHPRKLTVSFDLHVYSKPSGKEPRDPSCPEK